MRKSHVLGFGNLVLVGALVFAGCGGTSNPKDASGTGGNRDSGADRTGGTGGGGTGGTGGGSGGTGGGGTGGGTGGATDGGADRTGGTGGTDAGAGGSGGGGTGGTDAGAGGTGGGAGGTGGTDAGAGGTGGTVACTTTFSNGRVEFAFDRGANVGWSVNTEGDAAAFSLSLGASQTDGHACPGAVSTFVTYPTYNAQKFTLFYNHNSPPLDWTPFSKTHFWVKVVASDYTGINGVQAYVQSATNYSNYKSTFVGTSTFTDGAWHEVVVDTSASVKAEIVQLGVQVQMKTVAADAGVPPGGNVTLLIDDVWNENNPPPPEPQPEPQPEPAPEPATDGGVADAAPDAATGN